MAGEQHDPQKNLIAWCIAFSSLFWEAGTAGQKSFWLSGSAVPLRYIRSEKWL
jgi:hypothetical protein